MNNFYFRFMGIHKLTIRIGLLFILIGVSRSVYAMTLSGPISVSSLSVEGQVTASSVTVSTLTISNLLNVIGIGFEPVQKAVSFSTSSITTTTTTYYLTDLVISSFTLSNSANYVRLSVSGMLATESTGGGIAYLTVMRDGTDLGNTVDKSGLAIAGASLLGPGLNRFVPVGITITDSPGDTSPHNYGVYLRTNDSTFSATFTNSSLSYFLAEEKSR